MIARLDAAYCTFRNTVELRGVYGCFFLLYFLVIRIGKPTLRKFTSTIASDHLYISGSDFFARYFSNNCSASPGESTV